MGNITAYDYILRNQRECSDYIRELLYNRHKSYFFHIDFNIRYKRLELRVIKKLSLQSTYFFEVKEITEKDTGDNIHEFTERFVIPMIESIEAMFENV